MSDVDDTGESMKLPGDKIAAIEEFEAGPNTFDDGNMVRAAVMGMTSFDKKLRIASLSKAKDIPFPKVGDIVIGQVAAVMSSMIAVSIDFINGRPISSKVECICSTRNIRKKTVALANDVVSLKVISHLNGTIHGVMDEANLGVIFTKCRKCGGQVIQMRDAVKCKDCAWIDDRKLSSDFEKSDFLKMY